MASTDTSSGLTTQVVRVALTLGAMYGVHTLTKHYWQPTDLSPSEPSADAGDSNLMKELKECQAALELEKKLRLSERTGRIRADKERRKAELELLALQQSQSTQPETAEQQEEQVKTQEQSQTASDLAVEGSAVTDQVPRSIQLARKPPAIPNITYGLKPIGFLKSCFSQRNGTPRQPLLAPMARARLQLVSDVPPMALEGLEGYSHVWILYLFHENTDLAKSLQADRGCEFKAKIRVPRLNGGKMGVLATRSPHRPVPIGLSVAKVLSVTNGVLVIGGADIVDGSPVLDIKPYVPFCDSLPGATAPDWVRAEATDEPLHVSEVLMPPAAVKQVEQCWGRLKGKSLYASSGEFLQLVEQVLSRDIRSLHQRMTGPSISAGSVAPSSPAVPIPSTSPTLATTPPPSVHRLPRRSLSSHAVIDFDSPSPPTPAAVVVDVADISQEATVSDAAVVEGGIDASNQATLSDAAVVEGGADASNQYHVVLEGIDISYSIRGMGAVELQGARMFQRPAPDLEA